MFSSCGCCLYCLNAGQGLRDIEAQSNDDEYDDFSLFYTLGTPLSPQSRQNFLLDVNRQPLWGVLVVLCLGANMGPGEFLGGTPKYILGQTLQMKVR